MSKKGVGEEVIFFDIFFRIKACLGRDIVNVNLEYYKIFYYVGKLGGITLAAEELSITQPAVSQAIRALERALSVELFVRTGKGVRLTPAGEMLYAYISRGYEEIMAGERKVKEMLNMENGEIHIGASDMTLRFYLLPLLQKFHEEYPGIHLVVTNGPTPETVRYLNEGKIDFGLVTAPLGKQKGFEITELRTVQDIFVAGERFRHLEGGQFGWKKLRELPIVCLEKHTSTRSYVDDFLKKQGVVIQPEIELATSDMIVQFAQKDLGIACVVRDFAEEYLKEGSLFELKFESEIPPRPMYLVTNRKMPMSSAAARFLDLLNKHVKEDAGVSDR